MRDLRSRTVAGLGWSGASQLLRQAINFGIGVLLARLLTPDDFGLLGMVMVFTGFVQVFTELGLGSAIIQKPDLEEKHRSTVFWVNLLAGLLLTLLVAALAPLLASFYSEPALVDITIVIAFNFLLGSIGIVQRALLRKEMNFRRLFLVDVAAAIVAGAIAIVMALTGYGVWSLVARLLMSTIVSGVMLWALTQWKPKPLFDFGGLKELLGFSSNLLGFSAINYWIRNFDNLLVGRVIGPSALGIYTRAYGLMLLPLNQVSSVVSQVMFPALSSIQDDFARIRRVYLRANRSIALITFPLMVGLFVVADSFILAVYGEQWAEVIPILRVFCLVGLMQSVGTTVGWIYTSQGRTDLMFRWGLLSGIVRGLAFLIGIRWGVFGVAVAYAASGILLWYPSWAIPGRLVNLSVSAIVTSLSGIFIVASAMGFVVALAGWLTPSSWPAVIKLTVQVTLGVIIYLGLLHLLRIQAYQDVRSLLAERAPLFAAHNYRTKR